METWVSVLIIAHEAPIVAKTVIAGSISLGNPDITESKK